MKSTLMHGNNWLLRTINEYRETTWLGARVPGSETILVLDDPSIKCLHTQTLLRAKTQ